MLIKIDMNYIESVELVKNELSEWSYKINPDGSIIDKNNVIIAHLDDHRLNETQLELLNDKLNEDITNKKVNIFGKFSKTQLNGLNCLVYYQFPSEDKNLFWERNIRIIINSYNEINFLSKDINQIKNYLEKVTNDLLFRLNS